jgi:hypothetical protein
MVDVRRLHDYQIAIRVVPRMSEYRAGRVALKTGYSVANLGAACFCSAIADKAIALPATTTIAKIEVRIPILQCVSSVRETREPLKVS